MAKQYAVLDHIRHDRRITPDMDSVFYHHIRTGLLLALKERGLLNEIQYRQAQERLDHQQRKQA